MKGGRKLLNEVQYGENGYLSFAVEATNKGGHSSVPRKDNAVYELAKALVRLSDYEFPAMLDDGRRAGNNLLAVPQIGMISICDPSGFIGPEGL